MIYLSGTYRPELSDRIGLMVTPMMSARHPVGRVWAADTGCFLRPDRYNDAMYVEFLTRRAYLQARCLFATAPDVVGDAMATVERSLPMLPVIRSLGYPAALVVQNGAEDLELPWDALDVIFVGGVKEPDEAGRLVEWKTGPKAAAIVAEAKRRGKWVHVGRVNSLRRMRIAQAMGADSVDGTHVAFKPDVRARELESWLDAIEGQQSLFP